MKLIVRYSGRTLTMIYGTKTELGPIEERHLPLMVEYRNDPNMRQYFREYRLISIEHQTEWWNNKVRKDPSWEYFIIRPTDDYKFLKSSFPPCNEIQRRPEDDFIGMCGLTYIHPVNRSAEFAIVIGRDEYRGKGYGSDALKALIRYGFNDLNLHRIYCEVFSNNPAISLYKKMGFVEEGILRDTYYCHGKYWNSHVLSMTKHDICKVDWF